MSAFRLIMSVSPPRADICTPNAYQNEDQS